MAETLETLPDHMDATDNPNPNSDSDSDMDAAENPTNRSDSDSETDSDSEDEARAVVEIETLEAELGTNPANYDAHVNYIKALRKQGELDKLRNAREAMSELFPLSPAMWQEWAKDEISLGSGSDSILAIEKIFERGIRDYLSVSLWCDYLNFLQEYDPLVRGFSFAGISKARDLFERALIAAGLHVAEGDKIWDAYIKFEEGFHNSIDATDVEAKEKQVQRIRNIFHRLLSVPNLKLSASLLKYKAWESGHGSTLDVNSSSLDDIPAHVASAYQKAYEMLSVRSDLEQKILGHNMPETERHQQFMNYLKFEQTSGDPPRIQSLFERAITEFPISSELWLDYTCYLDKTLKADRTVRDVYHRAVRNCPWVGELWARYILCLERGHASEKEICDVFEKSVLCTFSTLDEYVDIFLTRVDGLRRRISFARELDDTLDYALIRDTFKRASDYLSPQLKNTYSLLQIHSYWARLESTLGKDLTAARGVWESLLKSSGSMLEAWQGYISMELEMGHVNAARSLYKRCYTKRYNGTGSEDICHSWIRFEREHGTLEDLDHAYQKVTPRLHELQLFRIQQENIASSTVQKEEISKKNVGEKRKPVSDVKDEQSPAKRRKETQTIPTQKGKGKAQVNNSVEENKKEGGGTLKANPDGVKDKQSPAPLRKENKGKGKAQVNNSVDGNDGGAQKAKPGNESQNPIRYTDQCTVFISNLGPQATEEDLRSFFSDVGGVTAIRILKDKFTKKSRGLAFVDFSDDAHLESALAKDKQKLRGKKLNIARSDPPSKKRGSGGHVTSSENGQADQRTGTSGSEQTPGSLAESGDHHGDASLQFKRKNTFALPRSVRALGQSSSMVPTAENAEEGGVEALNSNDEFRKVFLKK